jgi:hypothetical protein
VTSKWQEEFLLVDGSRGWRATLAICSIARSCGWTKEVKAREFASDYGDDEWDDLHDAADEAMEWLTATFCAEGYEVRWDSGEIVVARLEDDGEAA